MHTTGLKVIWATVLHSLLEKAIGEPVDKRIVAGTFWPEQVEYTDAELAPLLTD